MEKNHKAWSQYEAGKAYKSQIGLYENNRRNERFYRGEQWYGSDNGELPTPVFNVIRRVVDFLVNSVASTDLKIRYTDDSLPYVKDTAQSEKIKNILAHIPSTCYTPFKAYFS